MEKYYLIKIKFKIDSSIEVDTAWSTKEEAEKRIQEIESARLSEWIEEEEN